MGLKAKRGMQRIAHRNNHLRYQRHRYYSRAEKARTHSDLHLPKSVYYSLWHQTRCPESERDRFEHLWSHHESRGHTCSIIVLEWVLLFPSSRCTREICCCREQLLSGERCYCGAAALRWVSPWSSVASHRARARRNILPRIIRFYWASRAEEEDRYLQEQQQQQLRFVLWPWVTGDLLSPLGGVHFSGLLYCLWARKKAQRPGEI